MRTVDYGQLLIDGASGDISDMARVIDGTGRRRQAPPAGDSPASDGTDPSAPDRRG